MAELSNLVRALSLMYHDLAGEGTWPESGWRQSLYTVERTEFARQIDLIRAVTDPARVCPLGRRGVWTGLPIFLTFDDGALSAHTCAATLLERFDWRGHFFVTTDWIGRPGFLDRAQIRDLHARGHVIGSHSRSHPERMSHLSETELDREWKESCQVLSDLLAQPVKVASVAGGYYSSRVGRAAARSGIEVLFTSEPTTSVGAVDGCLVLGRYSVRRSTPAAEVAAIAAGARGPRYQQAGLWLAKKAAKSITGEWFLDLRRWFVPRTPHP